VIPPTTHIKHNNHVFQIKSRRIIMTKLDTKNKPSALDHAIKVIKTQMDTLATQIREAQPGEERDALEAQMKTLMGSIGMEYVSNPDLSTASAPVVETSTVSITSTTTTATPAAPAAKLSWWQRAKLCYQNNVKKFWAGLAVLVGGAAGAAYYYTKIKNSSTVSSVSAVSHAADVAVEVTTDVGTEAPTPIFTRIGTWIIDAGAYVKNAAIGAWAWVKNLFNKSTKETSNGNPEVIVDAVPA
jgi:hypothetical protein